jgi:hypothetical protein
MRTTLGVMRGARSALIEGRTHHQLRASADKLADTEANVPALARMREGREPPAVTGVTGGPRNGSGVQEPETEVALGSAPSGSGALGPGMAKGDRFPLRVAPESPDYSPE